MRTRVFLVLGALELGAAVLLLLIGGSLPRRADVERTFGSARELAGTTRRHVEALEGQVSVVREVADGMHGALHPLGTGLQSAAEITLPVLDRPLWPDGHHQVDKFQKVLQAAEATGRRVEDLAQDLVQVRQNLQEMETSLDQYSRQTAQGLGYSRLLMWLVAAMVGLHGGHQLLVA